MKTILVATDFSDAGHNASLYAADLARAFNARVVLFNAIEQAPVPVSEVPVLTLQEMGIRAEQQLKDEKQLLTTGNWLPIETVSRPGTAAQSILQAVKEANADIIIAGMKNTGTAIRRFFGSTVTALVNKLPVPLLIVPEGIPFIKISTIALANESDVDPDSDPRLLDALREIGERFHSKLYLVRVAENQLREAYGVLNRPLKINKMVRTLDPVYECIEGKNIPEALNNFIEAYNINLLALLPHQHTLLERWFYSSVTRSMIFKSQIPLLIIPEQHKSSVIDCEPW
ncbi:universal stress protein [Niastella caeni]|uniref:Universal stress protein n=1 Tax=Niastella caeni TaxID=2569763 RepID=A0A4S8HUE5_9BACT|nr:universal stress protein [Niastella caeni]THU38259.1 universal stress protein [Niastella caeni]